MEELLALALEDPDRGRARAEQVLVGEADPLARSYAHQCLGIVHRERGDHEQALRELRAGLDLPADAAASPRPAELQIPYVEGLRRAGRVRQQYHRRAGRQ